MYGEGFNNNKTIKKNLKTFMVYKNVSQKRQFHAPLSYAIRSQCKIKSALGISHPHPFPLKSLSLSHTAASPSTYVNPLIHLVERERNAQFYLLTQSSFFFFHSGFLP